MGDANEGGARPGRLVQEPQCGELGAGVEGENFTCSMSLQLGFESKELQPINYQFVSNAVQEVADLMLLLRRSGMNVLLV